VSAKVPGGKQRHLGSLRTGKAGLCFPRGRGDRSGRGRHVFDRQADRFEERDLFRVGAARLAAGHDVTQVVHQGPIGFARPGSGTRRVAGAVRLDDATLAGDRRLP
jgi:hypothetical protein